MTANARSRRRSARCRSTTALVVVAACLVARAASAQNTRDPAAAEALWREARALRAAGKVHEACPKFAESYRLDPALGALLNLAACHAIEGRTATAWAEFRDAEEQAHRAQDPKREAFAKKEADELEPRLGRLAIHADGAPPGLVVTRDGERFSAAGLGASIPVDPGPHELEARAPGFTVWKKQVDVRPGDRIRIDVPKLVASAEPDEAATEPKTDAPASPAPASSPGGSARTAAFVFGGVAFIGLAVGVTFGLLTGSTTAQLKIECPKDVCNTGGLHDLDRANTYAWVADTGYVGGGAAAVTAGVLFLVSRSSSSPPPPVAVAPTPGGAMLTVRGVF